MGPGHRRRAAARVRRGGTGRHGRVVDLGADARRSSIRSTIPSPSPSSAWTVPPRPCSMPWTPARRRRMSEGMRVAPRWRGTREGRIDDIICFVPGETPETEGEDTGRADRAGDPDGLPGLDHLPEPGPRGRRPGRRGVPGAPAARPALSRPANGCTPADGATARSMPSSSAPSARSTCPTPGTITNFAIVTPVQYPGQTETEPFVRAFVLLDGTDVIIPYSAGDRAARRPGAGRPAGRRGVGLAGRGDSTRGAAWAGAGARCSAGSPTANPIIDDPDLVNRIF